MRMRGIILLPVLSVALWGSGVPGTTGNQWNPGAAAAYLDQRIEWWMNWPGAARDHGTFCVSCHTALAYVLARPFLRSTSEPAGISAGEQRCLDNVTKRVRLWNEVRPYYGGSSSGLSRGTEAVLNAVILAKHDCDTGALTADTRTALSNMWDLQLTAGSAKGAWQWIQFNNEPWEAHDSQYYGAAMASLAVGMTPSSYRDVPELQERLTSLRQYLQREFAGQSLANQTVALWASAKWPDLLTAAERNALIRALFENQQRDGGWSISSLVWSSRDWSLKTLIKLYAHSEATPLNPKSDGYATGLVTLALEQCGVSSHDMHIKQARAWLVAHQNKNDGRWPAYSVNGKRDHAYGEGLFMDDAATAFAVMALATK